MFRTPHVSNIILGKKLKVERILALTLVSFQKSRIDLRRNLHYNRFVI